MIIQTTNQNDNKNDDNTNDNVDDNMKKDLILYQNCANNNNNSRSRSRSRSRSNSNSNSNSSTKNTSPKSGALSLLVTLDEYCYINSCHCHSSSYNDDDDQQKEVKEQQQQQPKGNHERNTTTTTTNNNNIRKNKSLMKIKQQQQQQHFETNKRNEIVGIVQELKHFYNNNNNNNDKENNNNNDGCSGCCIRDNANPNPIIPLYHPSFSVTSTTSNDDVDDHDHDNIIQEWPQQQQQQQVEKEQQPLQQQESSQQQPYDDDKNNSKNDQKQQQTQQEQEQRISFLWWKLRELAITKDGFLSDSIRQIVWPLLIIKNRLPTTTTTIPVAIEKLKKDNLKEEEEEEKVLLFVTPTAVVKKEKEEERNHLTSDNNNNNNNKAIIQYHHHHHPDYEQMKLDVVRNEWKHLVSSTTLTLDQKKTRLLRLIHHALALRMLPPPTTPTTPTNNTITTTPTKSTTTTTTLLEKKKKTMKYETENDDTNVVQTRNEPICNAPAITTSHRNHSTNTTCTNQHTTTTTTTTTTTATTNNNNIVSFSTLMSSTSMLVVQPETNHTSILVSPIGAVVAVEENEEEEEDKKNNDKKAIQKQQQQQHDDERKDIKPDVVVVQSCPSMVVVTPVKRIKPQEEEEEEENDTSMPSSHPVVVPPHDDSTTTTTTPCEKQTSPLLLRYYQGYHDYSSIVLSVMMNHCESKEMNDHENNPDDDDTRTVQLLHELSCTHLYDHVYSTSFRHVQAILEMSIYPMLLRIDPTLHHFLVYDHEDDVPPIPYFLLSWILTWFSYDILKKEYHSNSNSNNSSSKTMTIDNDSDRLLLLYHHTAKVQLVKRIYDYLIVSHPSMVLYVALAILTHPTNRNMIMNYNNTNNTNSNNHTTSTTTTDDNENNTNHHKDGADFCSSSNNTIHNNELDSIDLLSILSGLPKNCINDRTDDNENKKSGRPYVSFEEIISLSLQYMNEYPPHTIHTIAQEYYHNKMNDESKKYHQGVGTSSLLLMKEKEHINELLQLIPQIHIFKPMSLPEWSNNHQKPWIATKIHESCNPIITSNTLFQSYYDQIKKRILQPKHFPPQPTAAATRESTTERSHLLVEHHVKYNDEDTIPIVKTIMKQPKNKKMTDDDFFHFIHTNGHAISIIAAGYGSSDTRKQIEKSRRCRKQFIKKILLHRKNSFILVLLSITVAILMKQFIPKMQHGARTTIDSRTSDPKTKVNVKSTKSMFPSFWFTSSSFHNKEEHHTVMYFDISSTIPRGGGGEMLGNVSLSNKQSNTVGMKTAVASKRRKTGTATGFVDKFTLSTTTTILEDQSEMKRRVETKTLNSFFKWKWNDTTELLIEEMSDPQNDYSNQPPEMSAIVESDSLCLLVERVQSGSVTPNQHYQHIQEDDRVTDHCMNTTWFNISHNLSTDVVPSYQDDKESTFANIIQDDDVSFDPITRNDTNETRTSDTLLESLSSTLHETAFHVKRSRTASNKTNRYTTRSILFCHETERMKNYTNNELDVSGGCTIAGRQGQLLCLMDGSQICRPIRLHDGSIDLLDLSIEDVTSCGPCPNIHTIHLIVQSSVGPERDIVTVSTLPPLPSLPKPSISKLVALTSGMRCPVEYGSCGNDRNSVLICHSYNRTPQNGSGGGSSYGNHDGDGNRITNNTIHNETNNNNRSLSLEPFIRTKYEICVTDVVLKNTIYEIHQMSYVVDDKKLDGSQPMNNYHSSTSTARHDLHYNGFCGCCDGFDPDIDVHGKCLSSENVHGTNQASMNEQMVNPSATKTTTTTMKFNPCCNPCRSQVPIQYRPCCCQYDGTQSCDYDVSNIEAYGYRSC